MNSKPCGTPTCPNQHWQDGKFCADCIHRQCESMRRSHEGMHTEEKVHLRTRVELRTGKWVDTDTHQHKGPPRKVQVRYE